MKTCTSRLTLDSYVNNFPLQKEYLLIFLLSFAGFRLVSAQVPCVPEIECSSQVVSCMDSAAQVTGDPGYQPNIVDNCGMMGLQLVSTPWPIAIADCDSMYSKVIYRMWSVPGGPVLCTDTTYVARVNILSDSLICPDGRDTIVCGVDPNPLDSLPLRAPGYRGPDGDTIPLLPGFADQCGVAVTFTDMEWPSCGNTKTVMRTWFLHDNCGQDTMCQDTIVIIDNLPPEVEFDTSRLSLVEHTIDGVTKLYLTDTVGMTPNDCVGHGLAPYATVTDNCSDPADISVTVSGIVSLSFHHYQANQVITLPIWNIAPYREILVYRSQDHCGQFRLDTVVLIVSDITAAVAVCHDAVNLSLTNVDQFTFMKALSMDAESYDNCAIYQILARRTDWETACGYVQGVSTPIGDYYQNYADWVMNDAGICKDDFEFGFTPEVPFCCDDVGKAIMVEVLIIDQNCNVDKCWGVVNVEDKLAPIVIDKLEDITISCNAYVQFYADMFSQSDTDAIQDAFGIYATDVLNQGTFEVKNIECSDLETVVTTEYYDGLVSDNCGGNLSERYTLPLEGCADNHILREFIANVSSDHGMMDVVYAKQKIFIEKCPLDLMDIQLSVKDTTVYGCGVVFGIDGKVTIQTPGPVLPQILPSCGQFGMGYFDKVFDIITGEACQKVLRTWCVVDWCQVGQGADWATIAKQPGSITFSQYIKVVDTVAPVINQLSLVADIQTANCNGMISSEIDATDACGAEPSVSWTLKNQAGIVVGQGTGEIAAPTEPVPPGDYNLVWVAKDDCGNSTQLNSNFSISSDAAPSVVAYTSLTTTLTPMDTSGNGIIDVGMAEVWAKEYNSSSAPPCGGDMANLVYLIAKGFANDNSPVPPDSATNLQFSCDDYVSEPTVIPVQFWVKDTVANTADYANVMLMLYDNSDVCGGGPQPPQTGGSITGYINTETQDQVANVEVRISSDDDEKVVTTGYEGLYALGLEKMDHATIIPLKDSDHGNGVSTADLIKVQKHILGIKPITSAYKLIAADANADGKINPIDLIQMRKVLLGNFDRFPDNTSWRFVDAKYQFKRPTRALEEDFPESIQVYADNLTGYKNFIGVKIGDLDDNVFASRSSGRSFNSKLLTAEDQSFAAGDNLKVPVFLSQSESIEGIQLMIEGAPGILNLVGIEEGQLEITIDLVNRVESNKMALSSIHVEGLQIDPALPLFYLNLQALAEGTLSEALNLEKSDFAAELYTEGGVLYPLAVSFEPKQDQNNLVLMQNRPNPFRFETVIEFHMDVAGRASLRVYDPSGKVVKYIDQYYEAGSQQIHLTGSELTPGILYYELRTSQSTQTKRMILLD
ncbi:MAG: T9SS type A sorting domain-containing protein [Saprospiraceae bacterium]|nr:T9SS type A sorting domain-containing protein [Saprospiraceae bacterium]